MAADFSATGLRRSRLRAEMQLIAARYGAAECDQTDATWVHVPHFPLPRGWSKHEVEILVDIPYSHPGYPSVAPEWFWTDKDLRTSDDRPINHFFTEGYASYVDRQYLDKGWGHFCIHVPGWRAASGPRMREGHTLLSYLDLIATIFRDRTTLNR
jgi:Prokaryotic E2 family E